MKNTIKYITTILVFFFSFTFVSGQIPVGYYDSASGLQGEELRLALHNIIKNHDVVTYDELWSVYEDTDKRQDGKVWDMYSNCNFTFVSDQCGSYSSICDCYNREHTVPQSWFNDASPMVSDVFHVIPTDGKVNGYRSNYPYGECNSGTIYGTGKLGSCTYTGYSGTVFEPADEYKGDIARIYFYMATRYMNVIDNWPGGASFSGDNLSAWTITMMLDWHHEDPVSQKEIDRNNVVYSYQDNRNPYVDNPIWADAVWDPDYVPDHMKESEVYFSVTPNPASDHISVKLNYADHSSTKITIYDISGKIKYSKSISSTNETIKLSDFMPGTYFIILESNHSLYRNKLIVLK